MTTSTYRLVFLGLSITSSWGNGHATTYRALLRALAARGHQVLFLERALPLYERHRDLPNPPYGTTALYSSIAELKDRFSRSVREADFVIIGSFVPEGATVGAWVTEEARGKTAFYDLDTPVTLSRLTHGDHAYLTPALIPRYDLILSATGGPTLERLERTHGAQRARALHCAADTDVYYPEPSPTHWDLGYLGTYSDDRQPSVERLLLEPARRMRRGRFAVGGAQYPATLTWPDNVVRVEHLPPDELRAFYNAQRFTLNLTRRAMTEAGWSPSARMFEAAACGTPVLSDAWPGIETFFQPGEEILLVRSPEDVLRRLREMKEDKRLTLGQRARQRIFAEHTAMHRAEALERFTREVLDAGSRNRLRPALESQPSAAPHGG
jgi:spore maturation protein CgeB